MRTASFSLGLEIMLPLVRFLHRMGPRRRAAASLQSRPATERASALAGPTGRRIPGFESEGEQPSGDNGSGGSSRGGHSPRRGDSRRLQPEFRRAYGGKGEGRRAVCRSEAERDSNRDGWPPLQLAEEWEGVEWKKEVRTFCDLKPEGREKRGRGESGHSASTATRATAAVRAATY